MNGCIKSNLCREELNDDCCNEKDCPNFKLKGKSKAELFSEYYERHFEKCHLTKQDLEVMYKVVKEYLKFQKKDKRKLKKINKHCKLK